MITCTYALYNFIAVPILFYVWMTIAFLVTSKKKQIKLNCIDFLNKYSWYYLGVSVLLVLLATVNSIGYQNRTKEYQKCFDAEVNDTVVSLERWGKMGNKVRLTNGESFGIFIAPLTKVIELENVIQKKKNIVILHKKAQNDTIVFVDSYDYEWTFKIANPSLKTIFED
ncbi:hypothetical protein EEL51_04525 [Muribaculaceae bacterium Isolate-110 (HZI)]|nr:hypothetical protein EEL51_04525 [Muribaculaceae bacterium Isolate-110 (HZI)]